MITVENFIKQCADSIKDNNFVVVDSAEWKDVLNLQISELYPEIAIITVSTISAADIDHSLTELDLSDENVFVNIGGVKKIFEIDSSGRSTKLESWTYDDDVKIVFLKNTISSSSSVKVVWYGEMEQKDSYDDEINMNTGSISILRKACLVEIISRILMDKSKLDRFRTLSGQMNEYVLMSMQKNYAQEILFSKRRTTNTLKVKTFG